MAGFLGGLARLGAAAGRAGGTVYRNGRHIWRAANYTNTVVGTATGVEAGKFGGGYGEDDSAERELADRVDRSLAEQEQQRLEAERRAQQAVDDRQRAEMSKWADEQRRLEANYDRHKAFEAEVAKAKAYNRTRPEGSTKMLVVDGVATVDYDPATIKKIPRVTAPAKAIAAGTAVVVAITFATGPCGGDGTPKVQTATPEEIAAASCDEDVTVLCDGTEVVAGSDIDPADLEAAGLGGDSTDIEDDADTGGEDGGGSSSGEIGGADAPPSDGATTTTAPATADADDPTTTTTGATTSAKTATMTSRRTCYDDLNTMDVAFSTPAPPGATAAIVVSISGQSTAPRATSTVSGSGAARFTIPVPGPGHTVRVASLVIDGDEHATTFGTYTTPASSDAACPTPTTTTTTTTTTMPTTTLPPETTTTMPPETTTTLSP